MFNMIINVTPLDEFKLRVEFQNNIIKNYDVKKLFNTYEEFKELEYVEGLFKQVKVDPGGYGVSWNDGLDLSCNELWNNGIQL